MTPRDRGSRARYAALLLATALLAACSSGEPGDAGSATGLDSPDRHLALEPTPLFTVGGMNAPEWASFGEIAWVRFDGTGRLYVMDQQARVISVIGPGGELVRTVGSPGQGPGELGFPFGFVVTPAGEVAVFDLGHQGWVVYDTTGAYLRNVRVDPQQTGTPGRLMAAHPDGGIVAPRPGSAGSEAGDTLAPHRPLVRYPLDEGGEPSVLYRAWDLPPTPQAEGEMAAGLRVRIPRERAFAPPFAVAVLPDGRIAVADSFTYRVRLLDGSGAERASLERPIAPTPVTPAIQEAEKERRMAEVAAGDGPRYMISTSDGGTRAADPEDVKAFMEGRIEGMVFADLIPVIEALAADSEGRIWVQRSSGTPGEPGPTDVITADARYLGTFPADGLRIPDAFGPDGLMARIETDDFDVPTIVVERLPREWN